MILAQRNHLWSALKIGSSQLDIGNYGCAVSDLAMINNKFGASCTPSDVAAHVEWFTPQGLVIWTKLNLKNAVFDSRDFVVDLPKIRTYLANLDKAVMLCVQLPKGTTHWMLADSEDAADLDNFLCDDSWSGLQKPSDAYGQVIGAAFFSKRVPALV